MTRKYKKIIVLLMIVTLFIIGQWIYRAGYIDFQALKAHKDLLKSLVLYNYYLAVLIFIVAYISTVFMALPMGIPLAIVAGFLFGPWIGALFVNVGMTVGAILVVIAVRFYFKNDKVLRHEKLIEKLNSIVQHHGVLYLIVVRFLFVIPSSVVNGALALTRVPLRTIAWTTSVGVIPVSLFFCAAGSHLDTIESLSDILTWKVGLMFGGLALLVLLPVLLRNFGNKKGGQ